MPSWGSISGEIAIASKPHDTLRQKYIEHLSQKTRRNVIVYYSGWLQKPELSGSLGSIFTVDDSDKGGFMSVVHGLDRSKGLDLVLHTPGGSIAATESLVDYLRSMFGTDVRAIVPQLAMSAGTMIAFSCKEVLMGKHSSLGPIDPQMNGLSVHGVLEEFDQALADVQRDASAAYIWREIISKYHPTFIGDCKKADQWSKTMVKQWLISGMFTGLPDADKRAEDVVMYFADHAETLSHDRHISADLAKSKGVAVSMLEDDQEIQDAVLSVHHICTHSLMSTSACKIIENSLGVAQILNLTGPSAS